MVIWERTKLSRVQQRSPVAILAIERRISLADPGIALIREIPDNNGNRDMRS